VTQFLGLTEFVARNAEWYPDKTAVIFEKRKLSWREFNGRINRIANHLKKAGLAKGDRVALLSQNCLEYPEIIFGALKAGGVIVPISTMLQYETVQLQLRDAGPKAIFAGSDAMHLIGPVLAINRRIVLGGTAEGWDCYQDFLDAGSEEEPGIVLAADDVYNIIYSSGTTGFPKGIVHTHQARQLFAMTCGLEFRIHNETVSLISTPLYSNGTQLIFLPTILMCGTLVLMQSFDVPGSLELIQREKVTHAFMVPTQFIRIMDHPEFQNYDTSSVEILLSAAAPLRKETKTEILEKFPNSKLAELYGITEGISTVLRPDEQALRPGSVGKPRLGGDIKIIDGDRELPRGEIGEIAGANFSMMREYYGNPEMTRDVSWHDAGGRLFIKTGDIGRLDDDGYLYILDRKKDLIISGGINIFPSDIEDVLLKHPEVKEAAVIGILHREWGESPLALVVKKDAATPLSENDLRNWANDRLASYQRLSAVEFRESLPKNDLGKILKSELRKSRGKSG
jgi:long-chain acyl-CoA synthetase